MLFYAFTCSYIQPNKTLWFLPFLCPKPAEQIESRTEGGCRRITPKFLGDLHGEAAEEEAVAGNAAAAVPAEAVRKETPKVAETEKKEAEVERK